MQNIKGGKGKKKRYRELPPAIVMGNKFKEYVQKDMNLKGGPVLITFSYMIWNEFKGKNTNASLDELFKGAMNLYNEYKKKGELQNMYKEAEKRFVEKKAAKKNNLVLNKNPILNELKIKETELEILNL